MVYNTLSTGTYLPTTQGKVLLPCQAQAAFDLFRPEVEITRSHRDVGNYISVYMTSYPIREDSSSTLL